MITDIIASVVLALMIVAAGAYEYHEIKTLRKENLVLKSSLDAIEDVRKEDQKNINRFSKKVMQVKREREDQSKKMEEIKDEKSIDVLDLSIPPKLRKSIEEYINGQRKAADNQH